MQSLRRRAQLLQEECLKRKALLLQDDSNESIEFPTIVESKTEVVSRKRKQCHEDMRTKKSNIGFLDKELYPIFDLPVELYYCIFEYLDVENLMKFRQLNHYFKHVIDSCAFIWARKIRLSHTLNNKVEFENYIRFADSNPFVDSIDIECSKNLSGSKSINGNFNKQLKVNLINLNIQNMFLFENIINSENLKISSLILPTNTNHFSLKNQFKALEKNFYASKAVKTFFKKLKTFDLNCLSYDLKLHTFFNPLNEANFVEIFLNIKFKHLESLCLRGYNKNLTELLLSLHKNFKHLISLKFEDCYCSDMSILPQDHDLFKNKKVSIESLVLNNCSNDLCYNLIFNFANLDSLKNLELFSLNTINFNCDFSLNFIKSLDMKLKGLQRFQTCICWKYFKKINFQFSENSTINEFQLVRSPLVLRTFSETNSIKYIAKFEEYKLFDLDTINEFLKDYLIANKDFTFKNLKSFTFELKLNDCSQDSFSQLNQVISKFHKNFSNLAFLNIHLFCVDHASSKRKKCKFYKKYCCSNEQLKFRLNGLIRENTTKHVNSHCCSSIDLNISFKYVILK